MGNEEMNKNTNINEPENAAENTLTDSGNNKLIPVIVIAVCTIAALVGGILIGRNIADKKKLAAAQEYIDWEAQNHTWVEATCQTVKTCSVCGATEGDLAEHEWAEATCSAPKTCKVCGATEGETLEHDWKLPTPDEPKTCKNCGATEGGVLKIELTKDVPEYSTGVDHEVYFGPKYWLDVDMTSRILPGDMYGFEALKYDIFTGEKSEMTIFPETLYGHSDYSYYFNAIQGENNILFLKTAPGLNKTLVECYDNDLNLISGEAHTINGTAGSVYYREGLLRFYVILDKNKNVLDVFDSEENRWLGQVTIEDLPKEDDTLHVDFDTSQYGTISCDELFGTFLVSTPDGDQFGYLDPDGNEIAMYPDATNFCDAGYALISKDGKRYDLIDKDFNVVEEGVAEGDAAGMIKYGSWNMFIIKKEGEPRTYLRLTLPE